MEDLDRIDPLQLSSALNTLLRSITVDGKNLNESLSVFPYYSILTNLIGRLKRGPTRRQCYNRLTTAYRCPQCYGPNVTLCQDCFDKSEHVGHNYKTFNDPRGYCDCGIFRFEGDVMCKHHNGRIKYDPTLIQKVFGTYEDKAKLVVTTVFETLQSAMQTLSNSMFWDTLNEVFIELSKLFQYETLYELFAVVSAECNFHLNGDLKSPGVPFVEVLFDFMNNVTQHEKDIINVIGNTWFVPLASHPANYKNYHYFVLGAYQTKTRFYATTLFIIPKKNCSKISVTSHKQFLTLLLMTLDCFQLFFDPTIIEQKFTNKIFTTQASKAVELFRRLLECLQYFSIEDVEFLETLLFVIYSTFVSEQRVEYVMFSEMAMIYKNTFQMLLLCSDDFLRKITKLLGSSNVHNEEFIAQFCNFFFERGRFMVVMDLMDKKNGNGILVPCYEYPEFTFARGSVTVQTHLDFLEIRQQQMNDISRYFSQMSFLSLVSEVEKSKENLIEFLRKRYDGISNAKIVQLIVWITNFSQEKLNGCLSQMKFYNQLETLNRKKLSLVALLNAFVIYKTANPFVPFAPSSVNVLYLVLCQLFGRTLGVWDSKNGENKIIESVELSEIMADCVNEQPLFVIHILWQRVLQKVVLKDDDFALIIFAQIHSFLQKYPTFYKSIYKLAIMYDQVTPGAQAMFVDSK
ncbi:hypothetical protein EIN_485640 [Entamoeba invadens IP1]|uniref:UBR-type domain-containing protein n=1 Tax=Entamoeba invadens IP1 TaxID=370355 RepID=A0A0A1U4I3_ENTIV|nr:hypothetical protein EIN_485640 [Entamoeba invadens IP1]ELP89172.1 hypothetical protein EIN_485640 [Entamoeba invadens IP1]|eukprot:XP_004255943.1 hypothetical protein EIN_485640 [Entamoeba invadens IP1]